MAWSRLITWISENNCTGFLKMVISNSLDDLRREVARLKAAPMLLKSIQAENTLACLLQYLAGLEDRICQLKQGGKDGQ